MNAILLINILQSLILKYALIAQVAKLMCAFDVTVRLFVVCLDVFVITHSLIVGILPDRPYISYHMLARIFSYPSELL